MCGICGVWGDGGGSVSAMVKAMRHRGPDDSGVYRHGSVALGMTRLAIVDTSPTGHQPMSNVDGTVWIVYNGELYNFHDERRTLEAKGHTFTSTSDTEVVLRMYEVYGDEFLERLRGMFALAIYDVRRGSGHERLVIARDHLGIKPVLVARAGGRVVFASEMKALLASRLVPPLIDPVGLRLLVTYGSVSQPRTMLAGVEMLPAGHSLVIESGRSARVERYWRLGRDRRPGLRARSYDEVVAETAAALRDSVSRHLVSDVPLGAFLSGGVDSSVLVALMREFAAGRVKTFSVGFEAEGARIDESDDARRVAAFLETDHTHVLVRGADVRDRLRHIAFSLDQPSVDGVNTYFISWAARQRVTVAVSGTGGDEMFAGYPWFITMAQYAHDKERASSMWTGVRHAAAWAAQRSVWDPLLRVRGGGRLHRMRAWDGFVSRYATTYHVFGARGAARLLAGDLRHAARAGRAEARDLELNDEVSEGSAIERVTGLCLRGYTQNQLLRDIDATSMAHSLEVRVPYLDRVIADLALSLPDTAKLGDLWGLDDTSIATYRATGAKRVLIDAARTLLPKDLDVQPKRGFAMPFDAWLRGPLREAFEDTVSETRVRARGWFDAHEALAIRDAFLDRRCGWMRPWLLLMIELWAQEVLDHAAA